jgi:hypothetical protein
MYVGKCFMHTAGLGFGADGYVGLPQVPVYRLKPHDSPLQIWEGSGDVIVLSGTPPNLASGEAHLWRECKEPPPSPLHTGRQPGAITGCRLIPEPLRRRSPLMRPSMAQCEQLSRVSPSPTLPSSPSGIGSLSVPLGGLLLTHNGFAERGHGHPAFCVSQHCLDYC